MLLYVIGKFIYQNEGQVCFRTIYITGKKYKWYRWWFFFKKI